MIDPQAFQMLPGKRALLIGTYRGSDDKRPCDASLDELERLCDTYGLHTAAKAACALKKIDAGTFLGKGKLEELMAFAKGVNAEIVIFDDEIAPHQQRNLEKLFRCPVIDRTELILEVFAQRAKTREAKLQIELARWVYQLPRLKRLWPHLSRQAGTAGAGAYLKGAGETQIEIDRRTLKRRIDVLKKEIETIGAQRKIQRSGRLRRGIPTFAIVGYTNAGKSTLLRVLTQADVLVEDKLFATLDTTTRKYRLPNRQEILLTDTVGFIRKIPHGLIAAFKSTLEEALFAHILLHVIDISHPDAEAQADAAIAVLRELGAEKHPVITVLNKVDQALDRSLIVKFRVKYPKTVAISALQREGFDMLLEAMMQEIARLRKVLRLRIPQSHYALVSEVMRQGRVITCEYEANDILLQVEIPHHLEHKVENFVQS